MKRETQQWLTLNAKMDDDVRRVILGGEAQDILDSDARQRAEIRRLTKECARRLAGLTEAHWHLTAGRLPDMTKAVAAIGRAVAFIPEKKR